MLTKNVLLSLVFLLVLALQSQASVRSLYRERADLFLHEKVGKMQNLLDNPARLIGVQHIILEDNLEIQIQNSQPHDPVYDKNNRQETHLNAFEAIVPIESLLTLDAGLVYTSNLASSETNSRLDDTRINDADKTFIRQVHGGVGTNQIPWALAGYDFSFEQYQHFIDFASNLASDYSYQNDHQVTRHGFGLITDMLELYAHVGMEKYLAEYNQIQEIEFATQEIQIHARKLFGEPDQGNILLHAQYSNYQLDQTLFLLGREGYDLDLPGNMMNTAGYWYLPDESMEITIGVELEYQQRDRFDVGAYAWKNYQIMRGSMPAEVRVRILPWCWVWLELDVVYEQDNSLGSKSLRLKNSYGMQFVAGGLEIDLYTLPQITLVTSDRTDEEQGFRAGMTATVTF